MSGNIARILSPEVTRILGLLRPNERIFHPGTVGNVSELTAAILSPEAMPLHITTSMVPGIDRLPKGALPVGTTLVNPFPAAGLAGNVIVPPVSYYGYSSLIRRASFDTAIVQVAHPAADGTASLGVLAEFTPDALRRSGRFIAVINPDMPDLPGSPRIALRNAALVVEIAAPLATYGSGSVNEESCRIAEGIAAFVEDGSTLEFGIGKVPHALMSLLTDRKNLRLHSGMLSDGIRILDEASALDRSVPMVSCVHVGTADHYDWLRDRSGIEIAPVSETHDIARLAGLQRFVAINSALSIDLLGQANLEMIDGRSVSAVGGAADFAHIAALRADAISIIGMPALGPKGMSRILPRLDGPVSLPRYAIDVIVTEFGAADLRGLGTVARAEAIISVAAPQHQDLLAAALAAA